MIIEDTHLEDLDEYISQLLKIDLYKDRNFKCCPHCGSEQFIKNGYYNGIQRYKCHKCRKTFSKTTKSLWYYSKKKSNLWVKFVELFLEKKSLRQCAESLGINLSTVFFWRHKVMSALKSNTNTINCKRTKNKIAGGLQKKQVKENEVQFINPNILTGDVFITYSYSQESCFNGVINFKMDFYRKEKRIYVVAAKGEDDSMIIMPISRNFVLLDKFKNTVYDKIDKKSYMVLYKASHLYNIAKNHNKRLHRKNQGEEMKIYDFEKNSNEWFRTFHGIATKYLESYLGYFILYNIDKCFNVMELINFLIRKLDFIKSHDIKFTSLSI